PVEARKVWLRCWSGISLWLLERLSDSLFRLRLRRWPLDGRSPCCFAHVLEESPAESLHAFREPHGACQSGFQVGLVIECRLGLRQGRRISSVAGERDEHPCVVRRVALTNERVVVPLLFEGESHPKSPLILGFPLIPNVSAPSA